MEKIRLNKFIANAGITSRRKADELIKEGRVSINGKIIVTLGIFIDPKKDVVSIDGNPIQKNKRRIYIALNKPKGYLATLHDELDRKTVLDLLPNFSERIFPVGRLDMDSEGLILLTNDGEFAYTVSHPKFNIEKEYKVWVEGNVLQEEIESLKKGVFIEGKKVRPKNIKFIYMNKSETVLGITIEEGRKREIRRMFYSIGHAVKRLLRTRIGVVNLSDLREGKFRNLLKSEIDWFFGKGRAQ